MAPLEILPLTVFLLVATPVAVVARAWLRHRDTVIKERAKTERMRQALRSADPDQRPAILRALQHFETTSLHHRQDSE